MGGEVTPCQTALLVAIVIIVAAFFISLYEKKPEFKPEDIQVGRIKSGPLLIMYDQELIPKQSISIVQGWLNRKGIDCIALSTNGTYQISLVDMGNLPLADINEIRNRIAEKVVVA